MNVGGAHERNNTGEDSLSTVWLSKDKINSWLPDPILPGDQPVRQTDLCPMIPNTFYTDFWLTDAHCTLVGQHIFFPNKRKYGKEINNYFTLLNAVYFINSYEPCSHFKTERLEKHS